MRKPPRVSVGVGLVVLSCVLVAACTTTKKEAPEVTEALERAAKLDRERRVNENWSVFFTVDQITLAKTYRASTFGRAMAYNGTPYGSKNIPFQVYYINNTGPFLMVGLNTYPGKTPTVRIDDNDPVSVGGMLRDLSLIDQLLTGKILRGRYWVWPEGARDMYVELEGFEEAWERLTELRKN